ncbi:MAG TPA: hypothetical protein VJO52_05850 [Gemmatimonadaceae bacterium]|nr:hypothetical protein [Gemmatimonadaceae bacterium]
MSLGAFVATACGGPEKKPAPSAQPAATAVESTAFADTLSSDTGADTAGQNATATVHVQDTARVRSAGIEQIGQLPPLADSLANEMTFLATFQTTFVAASRAKHVLMDIGRVDAKLKGKARLAAYEQAVQQLSPVKVGDRYLLHGPWGTSEAVVTGFGQWNGRIVAKLDVPPNVDSLAREKLTLVALAVHEDSATVRGDTSAARKDSSSVRPDSSVATSDSAHVATVDSCAYRQPPDSTMLARVAAVRDSLMLILQGDTARLPPDVLKGRKLTSSQIYGCFGAAHVLLFANAAADVNRYTREFAVLVDTTGKVVPLRVADVRFRVHDAIRALDVDGDKIDDVAAVGRAELTGGTVLLRLDLAKKRLTYVMSGFAWESY